MRIGKFVTQENEFYKTEGTNICGILLRVLPEKMTAIEETLTRMDGVEISQTAPDGRVVVVVEDTDDEWAGQIITRFPTIEGVLATSLVYHHCEPGDLEEELHS